MKHFLIAVLFTGIALSSTYAEATAPASKGCVSHTQFHWTSYHPDQDPAGLMVWNAVAPDGSKLEVLGRHQPKLTKTISAAGSCSYEMDIGGERFTKAALPK